MPPARAAAVGFAAQALAVPIWWLLLWFGPASRRWFFPDGAFDVTTSSFLLPDLAALMFGSAMAAWLAWRGDARAVAAAWFAAGASAYATVYTLSWSARVDAPLASPVMMVGSLTLSLTCALAVSRSR
jgi:hypothetical protein